jgi:hypothetical protein
MQIPEEIITTAKEAMLQFGSIPPLVFVHGTKSKMYMRLPFGETSTERAAIMTEAGITLAKSGKIGDLELVVFASEAWTSPARTPMVMPSQDPGRTEVLVISALDPKTNTQTLKMFTCIRDKNDAVIDLKPVSLPDDVKAEGPLLRSFLAGYQLFKR